MSAPAKPVTRYWVRIGDLIATEPEDTTGMMQVRPSSDHSYRCPECGYASDTWFTHIIRCGVEDAEIIRTENALPDGLYYSERKLWDRCPEARGVLARLTRFRNRGKS